MYVPACDERKVMKTTTIRADSLVFDLEDGVALNQKVCWGVGGEEGGCLNFNGIILLSTGSCLRVLYMYIQINFRRWLVIL